MTVDSLKENYRANAEKIIKTRLALKKVAKLENLEVSDEDADKEMQSLAEMYNMALEDVKKYVSSAQIKADLMTEKALNFLKGIAK